jgi:hypothetical protein
MQPDALRLLEHKPPIQNAKLHRIAETSAVHSRRNCSRLPKLLGPYARLCGGENLLSSSLGALPVERAAIRSRLII